MSLLASTFSVQADTGESAVSGLSSFNFKIPYNFSLSLVDGSAGTTGLADVTASLDSSVDAGSPVTLDLTDLDRGTTLPNADFSQINVLIVENNTAEGGGNLIIGGASNAFSAMFSDSSDKAVIPPGGVAVLVMTPVGLTVGATTKNLKVDSSAGTVDYKMVIVGTGVSTP